MNFKIGNIVTRTYPYYGLTINKDYRILDINALGSIKILTDKNKEEWFDVANFSLKEEFKTTKQKVLKLISDKPEYKTAYKELFPELFEDDKYINLLRPIDNEGQLIYNHNNVRIAIFNLNNNVYHNKAFHLLGNKNWELKEENGFKILIPTNIII